MAALAIPKDADQFPGVHVEIKRKLLVFIESQLGQRVQDACTLAAVLVIQV